MSNGNWSKTLGGAALALAFTMGSASAQPAVAPAGSDKPLHGGSIEIGTVYVTLSALSWDAHDFILEAQSRHRADL